MYKLKRLFSPSTLAASVSTAMVFHATLAWAGWNCLSVSVVYGSPPTCTFPNTLLCHDAQGFYWCCPGTLTCGGYNPVPPSGWCVCSDSGSPPP